MEGVHRFSHRLPGWRGGDWCEVPMSFTVSKGEGKLSAKERTRSWKSLWLVAFLVLFVIVGGGLFVLSRRSPRHERLYVKGVLYARGGSNQKAVEAFREAIELSPDHAKSRRALVETLVSAREFQEAEQELDAAVENELLQDQEAILRARLMSYRGAFRLDAAGPALDAELCEDVLEEDLRPAIETLEMHLQTAPASAEAHKLLGDIWQQVRAVVVQRRSLLYARAEEAVRLERPEQAQSLRSEAATSYNDEEEAVGRAVEAYRDAMESAPDDVTAHLALARLLLETDPNGPEEARELLLEIVQNRPDHRQARTLLARLASRGGDNEAALKHLDALEGDRPASSEVLELRTQVLLSLARLEEADAMSEELVRQDAGINSLLLRARVLLEKRDLESAIPILQRTAATMVRTIEQSRSSGKPAEMAAALGQAFAVQAMLGRAQEMADMPERALVSYEDALTSGRRWATELERAIGQRGDAMASSWHPATTARAGLPEGEADRSKLARICRSLGGLYTDLARNLQERRRVQRRMSRLESGEAGTSASAEDDSAFGQQAAAAIRGAVRAYTLALLLDPDSNSVRLELARQLVDLGPAFAAGVPSVLAPLLEAETGNAEARAVAARAAGMVENYERALQLLDTLPESMQQDPQMALLRAVALTETGRWDQVDAMAQEMLAENADAPAGSFLRGRFLLATGQPGGAVRHLREAVRKADGGLPTARFYLAKALLAQGDDQEAVAELRAVLESPRRQLPPRSRTWRDAHMLLARQLQGPAPELALAHVRQAMLAAQLPDGLLSLFQNIHAEAGSPPEDLERDIVAYASALVFRRDLEGALEVCRSGRQELGASAKYLRLMEARLLAQKGDYREAIEAFEELEDAFPARRTVLDLARLQAGLGNLEQAAEAYRRVLDADRQNEAALHGLVALYAQRGEYEKARTALRELDPELESAEIRRALVDLYAREGRLDAAVELARGQAQERPDDLVAQALLAHLQWQNADLGGLQETCRTIRRQESTAAVGYLEGLAHLASGAPRRAVDVYQMAPAALRARPRIVIERAAALFCDGQDDVAVRLLRNYVADATPSQWTAAGWWLLALIHAAGGETEIPLTLNRALALPHLGLAGDRDAFLRRVGELDADLSRQVIERTMLISVFRLANGDRAALQQAQRLADLLPEVPLVRCWQLSLVDAVGRHEEAVSGYRELIAGNPGLMSAWLSLARSYADKGDYGTALGVVEEALEAAAQDEEAQLRLAAGIYAEQVGRLDEAIAHYRAAAEFRETAAVACNNLAYALATARDDPAAAVPLAERAARLAGGSPAVLDTLGWVYYLDGRASEAVRYLEAARQGMPDSPDVRYHLGMGYLAVGMREEGQKELQEALALSPTFPGAAEARRMLSAVDTGLMPD